MLIPIIEAMRRITPPVTISNPVFIMPDESGGEPSYIYGMGWQKGYSFKRFLGNVFGYLDDEWHTIGVQQLAHQYYLQNGELGAKITAHRIMHFLGEEKE